MKKLETLFEKNSEFDTPKKINRFEKKVPELVIRQIETGVTIEDLENLQRSYKLPIFKYKTQITIHGLFPELENNYLYGYKNLFQNKNKSVGIKWTAIDEQKRDKEIKPALNWLGFRYFNNSTSNNFQLSRRFDSSNFQKVLDEVKPVFDKIDTGLFFGNKYLSVYELWGQKYLAIDLIINAIYSENIQPFLHGIGATPEYIQAKQLEVENQKKERALAWELERQENERKKSETLEKFKSEIDFINENYKPVSGPAIPGRYIKPVYRSYDNTVVFEASFIYLPDRAKIPRINTKVFETLNEAINSEIKESYSDRKIQNYKGFKMKSNQLIEV